MSGEEASGGAPAGAVLFDVDGTLIDTAYLHTVAWWQAFRQAGLTVPMARIHRAIGMGSDHLLDHLLGPDRDREADGALGASHDALFAAYWPSLQPLDGACRCAVRRASLRRLVSRGTGAGRRGGGVRGAC